MSFVCSERRPANDGAGIKGIMFYNIFSVVCMHVSLFCAHNSYPTRKLREM